MTTTGDLLNAIGAHLGEFELPEIASVHVSASLPGPQIAVQLSCPGPSALAQGLLTWADTLTEITTQAWRVPGGDSVHLSVNGRLPGGTAVQIYGGMPFSHRGPGADLTPGATTTLPLATLRHLATPGLITEKVTL